MQSDFAGFCRQIDCLPCVNRRRSAKTFKNRSGSPRGTSMPPKHSKRHAEILRLLGEEGTITIAELASRLEVSLETVRRDVKPLTRDGVVLKMHGAIGLPS